MSRLPPILHERYRVDRWVAEGGFGTVHAGHHLVLDVPVAIKVLRVSPSLSDEQRASFVARFLEEGRLLTRLHHTNIVSALDLGIERDEGGGLLPYLVMEWVEGTTLRTFLATRPERRVSVDEAWALFEPLVEALACAHAAGIVHRDLKPSNVMIVGGTTPRVIDFGVAKRFASSVDPGEGHTETVTPDAYTPAYAAPEQITHARTGPWTDVHALALMFTEMVTGQMPYGDHDGIRAAAVDPMRPTPWRYGVDIGALEPILARALALRPADRFSDAGALLDATRRAMRSMRRERATLRGESSEAWETAPTRGRQQSASPTRAQADTPTPRLSRDPAEHGTETASVRPPPASESHAPEHTTDSAAPASRTLHPSQSATARPTSRRLASLVTLGATLSLALLGTLAASRFRATFSTPTLATALVNVSSAVAASSVNAPKTLHDINATDLEAGIVRTGLCQIGATVTTGPTQMAVSCVHKSASVTVVIYSFPRIDDDIADHDEATLENIAGIVKGYRRDDLRLAYGADNGLVAMAFAASGGGNNIDVKRVFDEIFGDTPMLVRGVVGGAVDPLVDVEKKRIAADKTSAHRVSELTDLELFERLRTLHVDSSIVWSDRKHVTTYSLRRFDGEYASLLFYKSNAREIIASLHESSIDPVVVAQDGDAAVAITGGTHFANTKFLGQLLQGLGATPVQAFP